MSAILERLRGSVARPRRTIHLAVFGLYTRHVLQVYLQHLFVVLIGLLIAALTIDIAIQVPEILAAPPRATGTDIPGRIAWYLLLRSADIGTRLLPVGCFLGVLSAEVALTLSRERLIVANTGRTPYQCIVPALLLGCIFGVLQVGLSSYLRPLAMAAQIDGKLGEDGRRYDRTRDAGPMWLVSRMGLVKARIEYGPPPVLRDVTIYALGRDGQLTGAIRAESARPETGTESWLLHEAREWDKDGATGFAVAGAPLPNREVRAGLALDPVWIANLGINAMFLPQKTLLALANSRSEISDASEYRMWVHLRYADWLLPGGMILLASCLSLFFLAKGSSFQRVVAIALAGYAVHVLLRALYLLGAHGYIPPLVVGWFVPCLLIAVSLGVLALAQAKGEGRIAGFRWILGLAVTNENK